MLNKPQFPKWHIVLLAVLFLYRATTAATVGELLVHLLIIVLGYLIGAATLLGIYYWYEE